MNYPFGVKTSKTKNINYGNRGMNLEYDLNETNNYYLIQEDISDLLLIMSYVYSYIIS